MLFDLDKVTVDSFQELLREVRNSYGVGFKLVDQDYGIDGRLEPSQLVELTIGSTCRVGKEIWHKGETIKRPVSDLLDLIIPHNYVSE